MGFYTEAARTIGPQTPTILQRPFLSYVAASYSKSSKFSFIIFHLFLERIGNPLKFSRNFVVCLSIALASIKHIPYGDGRG